jgi:hypothetical protein
MISWTSVVPYALHEIANLTRPTCRFGSHHITGPAELKQRIAPGKPLGIPVATA